MASHLGEGKDSALPIGTIHSRSIPGGQLWQSIPQASVQYWFRTCEGIAQESTRAEHSEPEEGAHSRHQQAISQHQSQLVCDRLTQSSPSDIYPLLHILPL